MPTFSEDPIQGVSISDADLEAAAVAPVTRVMLTCIELYSANWADSARVVADKSDFTCTLESDAPRNASETVTFTAVPIRAIFPEETDSSKTPSFQLEIDGVSSIITSLMDDAIGSLDPIEAIIRLYASDDPSGPSRLPVLIMEFSNVKVSETTVKGICTYGDSTNDRFPSRAYVKANWPGLSAR